MELKTFYVFIGVTNPTCRTRPQEKFVIQAENEQVAMEKAQTELVSQGFVHDVEQASKYDFVIEAGSNQHHRIEVDLHVICPNLPTENNGYCRSYANHKEGPYYGDWEKNVATPALEAAGFELTWCWCDGEADSFGPLSRVTYAVRDGKHYEIMYG